MQNLNFFFFKLSFLLKKTKIKKIFTLGFLIFSF